MSDDWLREQTRLDQMRQDQAFRDQLVQNQFLDQMRANQLLETQRLEAQHNARVREGQRLDAQYEERRRDREDEAKRRQTDDLQQLTGGIGGFSGNPRPAADHTAHPASAGTPATTEGLAWHRLVVAGLAASAVWLARKYEEQRARQGTDSAG
jgi:hypothetical protein